MSFKIEQGLFNLDFTDYHAILGVSVDADTKAIRKQYLKIARRLHPDSFATDSEDDRQRASEFLSKLVNPAYEKLSQEKNYTEYCILLKLKGQHALRQQETLVLASDSGRQLAAARAVNEVEQLYNSLIRELGEQQYQDLDQTLEVIGQISELNLVYLMRKEGAGGTPVGPPKAKATSSTQSPAATPTPTTSAKAAPPTKQTLVEAYLRRAQEFEGKKDFGKAILELREALQIDPTSSTCHSRLGLIYFKSNQMTMAKIHFNQALKLNPQDPIALEGKTRLETAAGGGKAASESKPSQGSKSDEKPRGGLFGLFGGKKK